MIVDPDFLDHWKTHLLIEELGGDPAAPLYVLRLWAHCQNRRKSHFSLSDRALKALCRFPGQANKLVAALVASGFVTQPEVGEIEVCGWDEYNAKLLANWDNGKKGGRPSKNPKETQRKPNGNPTVTDKSRGDRIGEEKSIKKQKEHPWFEDEEFCELMAVFRKQSQATHNWIAGDEVVQAWMYELSRHTIEQAKAMLRFSTGAGAKKPITNGDHDRKSGGKTGGLQQREVVF